jgi:neurotrimin
LFSGPITEIVGGPDIYVDRGSTLNVTCAIAAGSKEPEFIMWSWKEKVRVQSTKKR